MFAMSVFQSVLERLKAEAAENEEDTPESPAHLGISGLPSGFVARTGDRLADAGTVARAYSGFVEEEKKPAPPVVPAHLARTQPGEIMSDLAITDRMTAAELNDLRRNFARDNHPDGVHPDFRGRATIRMTIANMLIDEAMRRVA